MSSYLKRLRTERCKEHTNQQFTRVDRDRDRGRDKDRESQADSSTSRGNSSVKLIEEQQPEKDDEPAERITRINTKSQEPQHQHLLARWTAILAQQQQQQQPVKPVKPVSPSKNIKSSSPKCAPQNAPSQLKYLKPILPLLLLYSFALIFLLLVPGKSCLEQVAPSQQAPKGSSSSPQVGRADSTAVGLVRGLIQQLLSADYSDRWTSLPSLQSQIGVRDPPASSPIIGHRAPISLRNPRPTWQNSLTLSRAITRLRSRIGARNSIRVHNAFRDLAWRLLSSFSMPTPIIYEIRRQHLYSLEDDTFNDSLYNKNTTKTIRSRRHLHLAESPSQLARAGQEHDSFPNRVRVKLEDLLSLERLRRNFGRVVKFPGVLFSSFKRQQQDSRGSGNGNRNRNSKRDEKQEDYVAAATATTASHELDGHLQQNENAGDNEVDDADKDTAAGNSTTTRGRKGKRNSKSTSTRFAIARLLQRHRRKKDLDRQMIYINGKEYYVNDEGQLKELHENE